MPEFSLHQSLHGYADGHRQIALSASLKPNDAKVLMTLSDSSGPGARFPDGGYLTGYPLVDSGYYVLARTWPAPEMPRPGCVWTHSLLIDFTDLASVQEMGELLRFFRRPNPNNFASYSDDLAFKFGNSYSDKLSLACDAERLLESLYGEPQARVIAASATGTNEELVLRIWSQQWPRLRRNFRFCTYSATDRSTMTAPFDLQILPPQSQTIRSRFVDTLDADRSPNRASAWSQAAIEDLAFPDKNGLRTFLRQAGSDVGAGREAFALLCQLHNLLDIAEKDSKALRRAVELLELHFGSGQARAARAAIAKTALREVHLNDETVVEFLFHNLDFVATSSDDELARIGQALWDRSPRQLESVLEMSPIGRVIVERTLERIPATTLAAHAAMVPDLVAEMLIRSPRVVAEPQFWASIGAAKQRALTSASESPVLAAGAAKALIDARRFDLVGEALTILGADTIGRAVMEADPRRLDQAWVSAIASKPSVVAKLFGEGIAKHRHLLVRLALTMSPDHLPCDIGLDPWVRAIASARGDIGEQESSYLHAFLMARALGGRTPSSAELIIRTFQSVHGALAERQMPLEGWNVIEPHLPWLMFTWDSGARLREAVVQVCIERALAPMTLHLMTSDNQIFGSLVNATATKSRGRDYLKDLCKIMKASCDPQFAARIKLLDKAIGSKDLNL